MSKSIPQALSGNTETAMVDPQLSLTPTPSSQSQTASTPTTGKRHRRIRQPSENSLYDLMHEHSGTSLFVRPIFWTDLHLELLGIQFQELPACDTPIPYGAVDWPPSQGHLRPSPAIRTLSDSLSEIVAPPSWQSIQSSCLVRTIVRTLWPEAFKSSRMLPEMDLHFDNKIYREAVRAPLMWDFPVIGTPRSPYNSHGPTSTANPTNLPMVCYIGKRQLLSVRRNLFRIIPGPRGSMNGPVARLQRLRSRMLWPTNRDQDPHLAGIFLGMAQKHFLENGTPSPRRGSGFQDVKLRILMDDAEKEAFIVYTATVTKKFLDRFYDPFKAPKNDGEVPGMKIEYAQVPFWPILGLRERLGKALGQDIVGPFDPELIETWVDEEPVELSKASKRKREALSEVVNASFEEDTDEESADEPQLGGKKRCLSEGPPMGMVA